MHATFSRRDFLRRAGLAGLPLVWPGMGLPAVAATKRGPVCLFSKHLRWLSFDEMADLAAEIGFEGVALTVRPGGHVPPDQVESLLPKAVEAVEKAGLHVPMMTTAITDAADPLTGRVLKTAGALGIRHYRMGYIAYDESRPVDVFLDETGRRLEDLAAMNQAYGLHGAYQNHDGTRVGGSLWDIWYMIRHLDPAWIGCQFDIRHATVEGGHSWPVDLRLISRYVRITAIKDFYWARSGGDWTIQDCPLGEGMVAFDRYFQLANAYGIAGPISVHFEYPMPEETLIGQPHDVLKRETRRVMARDVEWLKAALDAAGYAR
ncbi:MAG: sugar phosphate isomerase/epimerase family protein [Rhodothermales bacterium]